MMPDVQEQQSRLRMTGATWQGDIFVIFRNVDRTTSSSHSVNMNRERRVYHLWGIY